MSEEIAVEVPKILEDFTKLPDFNKLKGHGGSFLVVPLDQYNVFSKEQFTEDQKMFANAALEYALNRMKPVKEELKKLNKDLTLEIIKELGEHPDDKKAVRVMKGQYGPYIKYKSLNATIPEEKDPTELTMEEALILIEKRKEYDKTKKVKKRKSK